MTIIVGNTEVTAVNVNTTAVTEVWVNNTKVFPDPPLVPPSIYQGQFQNRNFPDTEDNYKHGYRKDMYRDDGVNDVGAMLPQAIPGAGIEDGNPDVYWSTLVYSNLSPDLRWVSANVSNKPEDDGGVAPGTPSEYTNSPTAQDIIIIYDNGTKWVRLKSSILAPDGFWSTELTPEPSRSDFESWVSSGRETNQEIEMAWILRTDPDPILIE